QFAEFGAVLAELFEPELGAQELRVRGDERGSVVLDQFRRREGAVELRELRLVIEKLQMARRAAHEEVNDALGLRRVVGGGLGRFVGAGEIRQRDRAEADAAVAEEPPAVEEPLSFGKKIRKRHRETLPSFVSPHRRGRSAPYRSTLRPSCR